MIAIPVVASTKAEALDNMERAEKMADLIEIRLDLLPREAWIPLLKRNEKPSIVTLRPTRQGGHFQGEEALRIRLLDEVLCHHPDFIDLEWDTPPDLIGSLKRRKGERTGLIISYHNFTETPPDLEIIAKEVISRGGDISKIVTQANCLADNVRILRLMGKRQGKMIAFCMGPFGTPSRILTLRAGGTMTFGALGLGKETAPGQIPASELREIYRVDQIHPGTRVFGLIGNPVSHSLSPHIHNAAFESEGCDAIYVPFQVSDVGNLIHDFGSIGVEGLSVTIPHKGHVIPLLDGVGEEARMMRAVNTVYRRDGQWLGTNTDVNGVHKALETSGIDFQKKRWTIIGAGGVARAVAYTAAVYGRPKSLTVLGRTRQRVEGMLRDMRDISPFPVAGAILAETNLRRVLEEADILVNGTPLGMSPKVEETPIPSDVLHSRQLVFDTIYNPMETRLLKEAKERGCQTISGFQMFLYQGAAQFELWTGKTAPLPLMEQKARERLER